MVKSQEYINGKIIMVNGSLPKLEEIRLLLGLEFSLTPKLQMINIANSNFEDEVEGQKLTTLRYSENKLEKNTTFKNSLTKLKDQAEFTHLLTHTHTHREREREREQPPTTARNHSRK